MTYDEVKQKILTEDDWTIGALMTLYRHQTPGEQVRGTTAELNDMGFNSYDAPLMTNIAEKFLEWGSLTKNQILFVRKTIVKYARQLSIFGVSPVELKVIVPEQPKPPDKVEKEATIIKDNDMMKLKIMFPYSQETVTNVKTLDGRWYYGDAKPKYWTADLSLTNVEHLKSWDFKLSQEVQDWCKRNSVTVHDVGRKSVPMKKPLYPFQEQGVAFLEAKNGRALIGDEPGLGKTWQAVAYLALHTELRPVVVVCPASLKLNWEREINGLMDNARVQIISGRPNNGSGLSSLIGDILIINYDILSDWAEILMEKKIKTLILDEIHKLKNWKTNRTKAVMSMKKIDHIIGLSGTPIVNRPSEFFVPLHLLDPTSFPSFRRFVSKYTEAKYNGFGWDYSKARNQTELHELLCRTVMIRRLKVDVLKDLPPKVRTVIPTEINNWPEYKKAENDFIEWVRGSREQFNYIKEMKELKYRIQDADDSDVRDNLIEKFQEMESKRSPLDRAQNAQVIVQMEKLKQVSVRGKMNALKDWIEDYLEQKEKLVIFAVHKEVINTLMEELKQYNPVKIDGSVSMTNRQKAVDAFQTDPNCRLFIGNIQAAGVGLTLTASDTTCFVELPWVSGELLQAEDRVHRIGQKADSINAYYLIAKDTIEEKIMKLLDSKAQVLSQVLDGKEVEGGSLLMELLDSYMTNGKE
jgi:SWI/SNF-related matrix-associated actin-dependent regulator 1 of chromatin subfamily A